LLFCAKQIKPNENQKFYSQIDFKDILLSQITTRTEPKARKKIFTQGNSGKLIYGKITSDGEYVFIDNSYLAVKTNLADEEVEQFNKDYQEYLNYFETLKE